MSNQPNCMDNIFLPLNNALVMLWHIVCISALISTSLWTAQYKSYYVFWNLEVHCISAPPKCYPCFKAIKEYLIILPSPSLEAQNRTTYANLNFSLRSWDINIFASDSISMPLYRCCRTTMLSFQTLVSQEQDLVETKPMCQLGSWELMDMQLQNMSWLVRMEFPIL
jgi:hypothetical protein